MLIIKNSCYASPALQEYSFDFSFYIIYSKFIHRVSVVICCIVKIPYKQIRSRQWI